MADGATEKICSDTADQDLEPHQQEDLDISTEHPNSIHSSTHQKGEESANNHADGEVLRPKEPSIASSRPVQSHHAIRRRRFLAEHSAALPTQQYNPTEPQISQSQTYMLRVCRALITYGAPTHRLETYMHRSADVLQLNIQAFYMPGCMIVSFDDTSGRSKDVQIIRCSQTLNLAKLDDVHAIYKDVIHKRITVEDATSHLHELMGNDDRFPPWFRVLMYGLASALIGPISYDARPIDLPLIFVFGCIVGFCELVVAAHSELYGYIFEMSSAILISFLARALGSVKWKHGNSFCFSAIAQASLVMILPGFTITTSALELQSKNIVSGAVRLVYGVIYTLFIAFGFIVGITIYGAIDDGATSSTSCSNTWPFWWQIVFVLPFTFAYAIVYQTKWKQLPAMLIVALAGWVVNHFAASRFPTVQPLSQALGALTVGLLANLYSRLFHGLAVAIMHPAIFIQVPGSFAASGSLINGLRNADAITHRTGEANSTHLSGAGGPSPALHAGYAMVEIAVGIAAGLSISALLTYPIRKKRGTSGLFTY